jgi:1D-myo-inositol 3-kinase
MAPSVIIAGHYCHDTLYLANGTRSEALGGSVSYISSVLSALEIECSVVSKVGPDFGYLSQISHAPRVVPGAHTTQYISDFTQGERIGRVGALCEPIYPLDLPSLPALIEGDLGPDVPPPFSYEIALAVGIVGEVLPETLLGLAAQARYLLCDVQGLIRHIDPVGRVTCKPLQDTPFYQHLDQISYLKASRQEAGFLDIEHVRQRTCLLVTEGDQGCTVYLKDREFRVPAFQAVELDPTGAGDCFLAGFAMGLLRGLALDEAVKLGNYYGALAVAQVGVPTPAVIRNLIPDGLYLYSA